MNPGDGSERLDKFISQNLKDTIDVPDGSALGDESLNALIDEGAGDYESSKFRKHRKDDSLMFLPNDQDSASGMETRLDNYG